MPEIPGGLLKITSLGLITGLKEAWKAAYKNALVDSDVKPALATPWC